MAKRANRDDPAGTGGVGRQTRLPLRHALLISARSVRNRLGRTFISMSAIMLGITFLVSTVTSDELLQATIERGIDVSQDAEGSGAVAVAITDARETRQKQIWLVTIALLVAGIGITNAMLMSVTERFREIGTMKCLGALDLFIVEILLFESAFLGLVGSVIGCVLGTVLSLISTGARYGFGALGYAVQSSWPTVVRWYGAALVLGLVLSILAVIYPAMQAAKMVPADAMRADV